MAMSMFSKKNKKTKPVEEEVAATQHEPEVKRNSRREHVFGAFLFGGLMLVVLAGLGGIGFGTYNFWQIKSAENVAPSISALNTVEVAAKDSENELKAEAEEKTSAGSESEVDGEWLKKAQALDVIVMNGGGAKGVASEASGKLKAAGFTKVTTGNTVGDFIGTTVYTKKDLEKEGVAVVEKLKVSYPTITYKEALLSDKETQTAPITVIFGK
jgi:LytR cell envelope-related transcriptional attenuator